MSYKRKTEEIDKKSTSSVSVPGAILFSEPFLRDLDLIWRVELNIDSVGDWTKENWMNK